jgi:hypothetical protein
MTDRVIDANRAARNHYEQVIVRSGLPIMSRN